MANKFEPLITVDEVQEILAEPKETVKPISWIPKPAANNIQWMEFASACAGSSAAWKAAISSNATPSQPVLSNAPLSRFRPRAL